jgi:hypothetical protein
MPAIEFTIGSAEARRSAATTALTRAAEVTLRAATPVGGGRPWRWRIADGVAELRVDSPQWSDPTAAREVALSAGVALHQARTALAGAGAEADVVRLPVNGDSSVLARIRVNGFGSAEPVAVRRQQAMALGRTNGQPLAGVPVPPESLAALGIAAEAEGAHLYPLSPADAARFVDGRGDAVYVLLVSDGDTPAAWLAAGEALSAVLLTAAVERLVAQPADGLPDQGAHPVCVLRIGVPANLPVPRTDLTLTR